MLTIAADKYIPGSFLSMTVRTNDAVISASAFAATRKLIGSALQGTQRASQLPLTEKPSWFP